MDFQRLILLAGLALVLMLLWQSWLEYDTPPTTVEQKIGAADRTTTETAKNVELMDKRDIPSVPSTPATSPSTPSAATTVPRTAVESKLRPKAAISACWNY
jgi:cytoskeletal protein RodZ